jgi:hypothetical protein
MSFTGCFLRSRAFQRHSSQIPSDSRVDEESTDDLPATIPRSGDSEVDSEFDRALAESLGRISIVLKVVPAFTYFDGRESDDGAFAVPRLLYPNTNGTVYFNLALLRKLRKDMETLHLAATAICAHEVAHILQFSHDRLDTQLTDGQPTVKRAELQADYLAGYVAGSVRRERPSYSAANIALALFNIGDTDVTKKQHHGTREERRGAVEEGYFAAYRYQLPLQAAVKESTDYVRRL